MNTNEYKILESAQMLFSTRGIRATRVHEIARQTGTSRNTIYGYFANKDSLVHALAMRLMNECGEYLEKNRIRSAHAIEELENILTMVQSRLVSVTAETLTEIRRDHYGVINKFVAFRNSIVIPAMDRNITRGRKEGYYRADFDRCKYTYLYFSTLSGVLVQHDTEKTTLEQAIHEMNVLYVRSILTQSGIRHYGHAGRTASKEN